MCFYYKQDLGQCLNQLLFQHVSATFAPYFPNMVLSTCAGMPSENSVVFVPHSGAF